MGNKSFPYPDFFGDSGHFEYSQTIEFSAKIRFEKSTMYHSYL